jgi:hypothetical protein
MEAPEKIYLQDSMSTDTIGDLWPEWFDAKVSDNSIEYIRTDAFIEKAMKWLDKELPVTDLSSSNLLDIQFKVFDEESKRAFIENFKKYMKGE